MKDQPKHNLDVYTVDEIFTTILCQHYENDYSRDIYIIRTWVLNGLVSHPDSRIDLTLVYILEHWPINECHIKVTDLLNWWTPIKPSVYPTTLYPRCNYQVRCNHSSNRIYPLYPVLPLWEPDSASSQSNRDAAFYTLKLQNASQTHLHYHSVTHTIDL